MSTHNINFHDKIRDFPWNILKYLFSSNYRKCFLGTEKRVRISHGKRAIGVRVFEVSFIYLLMCQSTFWKKKTRSAVKSHEVHELIHNLRNVPSDMCAQRRLGSACACAQSDQSICYPHEETLHACLSKMRPVKILIRLRECAGWSESSLGADIQRYVS